MMQLSCVNHMQELVVLCDFTFVQGLERRFKNAQYEVLISAGTIPELCAAELREEGLWVGAAVSLSQLGTKLEECQGVLPGNVL